MDKYISQKEAIEYSSNSDNSRQVFRYFYKYSKLKKSGGTREIFAYQKTRRAIMLKKQHKLINQKLQRFLCFKDNVDKIAVGFSGEDLVETAKRHKDNRYFFNFDFANFFPSLQIESLFAQYSPEEMGLTRKEVYAIVKSCNQSSLIQGSILSPVISNLIMLNFDKFMVKELTKMLPKGADVKSSGIVYTRYADDITISFPAEVVLENGQTRKIIHSNRLKSTTKLIEDMIWFGVLKEVPKNSFFKSFFLNSDKTRCCDLNKAGHYKVLSWNIVKGNNGGENYVTAGRKAKKTGYLPYQEHSFSKGDAQTNKRVGLHRGASGEELQILINNFCNIESEGEAGGKLTAMKMLVQKEFANCRELNENKVLINSTGCIESYLQELKKYLQRSDFVDIATFVMKDYHKRTVYTYTYDKLIGGDFKWEN